MNKFFSPKLWLEGMRRLKLPGFLTLGFVCVNSLLVPLLYFVSGSHPENGILTNPSVFVVYTVAAPVMTLILFSFLNKRKSADFFHAIPYTRLSLIVSFFIAEITWLFGTIAASSLIACFAHLILGSGGMIVPYLQILPGVLAATLLMCAGITLGMTLTGTLFSNVAVSALILYLPGFFMTVYGIALYSATSVIVPANSPLFLIHRLNLVVGSSPLAVVSLFSFTSDGIVGADLTNPAAWIYTATLALIYIALACVAFCRRKSEMAGSPAPSGFVNTLFRIAITMLICIPTCAIMFFDDWSEARTSVVIYAFLYTVAITVWVVWELITTKRWVRVLKSLPGLLIVVALNVLLVLSLFVGKSTVLAFTPEPDEIRSAAVFYDADDNFDMAEYGRFLTSRNSVTDRDSLKALSDALSRTVDKIKADQPLYDYTNSEVYAMVKVRFNVGRKTVWRLVQLSESDIRKIRFSDEEDAVALSVKIPYDKATWYAYSTLPYTDFMNGGPEESEIIGMMKDELSGADAYEWYEYTDGYRYTDTGSRLEIDLSEYGYYGRTTIHIPLSTKFFPQTTQKFLDLMSRDNTMTYEELTEILGTYDAAGDYYSEYSISVTYCRYDEAKGLYVIEESYLGDYANALDPKKLSDEKIEVGDSFVVIGVERYAFDKYDYDVSGHIALKYGD